MRGLVPGLGNWSNPGEASGEDSRLLREARDGCTRAFGSLVRRHQDAIFGLVSRMVRDHAVAEELTQDVFLKAFRKLDAFRGDAKFSTWLYRIAVNVCHDYRASVTARIRREEMSLEAGSVKVMALPAPGARPDDQTIAREMAGAFQACLDRLNEPYRGAFVLRHQQGLGYDEIASVLGISRSNAKVRVHRAREMILGHLRRMGHDV